jgi:tetratricopeptide (TPR) repeat protein
MNKFFKLLLFVYVIITNSTLVYSSENFFDEAMAMYQNEKYEEAQFMFERNIVYNPKDAKTYLYLAKIYNYEENQRQEENNLETTLLIEPDNEEALLMLMKIALKKSNYSKVKDLSQTFIKVCNKLCNENDQIQDTLKNLDPKNES